VISVRRPETDAELEGWIRVRRTVYPNESAWTVQDFREREWGEQLFLIAELDGEIVGNGMADRSDIRTRGFASARVVPEARRRGVGTALLHELVGHVADGTATIELDDWLRDEATHPGGSFVALADGEIVGFSGLMRHDNDGVAEDGLTVVRRDWRRRGLAHALKARELAWAAENGLREIVTWTQRGNDGMRSLNERLGYEYRNVSSTLVAHLPLAGLG
jgi:GNAT superfamily N-acetyltransferase